MSDRHLTIGTRASPLALAQTTYVASQFSAAHNWPRERLSQHEIMTIGDKRLEMPLAEIGGKGLFTQELEAGLLDGSLDFAVHSLKDLPTAQPDGLTLAAILPRAPVGDILVPRQGLNINRLDDLPNGARIGTSALRRRAQILNLRPDLEIIAVRGNVGTRLKKLQSEKLDAIVLAAAGLTRLDIDPPGQCTLADEILPAAGQGALAVQCRADDEPLIALLSALHCTDTAICVTAERAFLAALDGSCRTPIAAHAKLVDGQLHLQGRLLDDDGRWLAQAQGADMPANASALGEKLAADVRRSASQSTSQSTGQNTDQHNPSPDKAE